MRPARGSSSTSSATASATLARTGATWNRSMRGTGLGVRARIAASRRRIGVSPVEQVGRQAGEALVGADAAGHAAVGVVGEARRTGRTTSLNVLHSSSRASSRSRSSHSAELVVEVDVGPARAAGGGP